MRVLELALLLAALAGLLRMLVSHRPVLAWATVPLVAVPAVGHLLVDRPRWQLVPVYLVAAAVVVVATADAARPRGPLRRRWPVLAAGLVAGLGGLLAWALPVPELRAPQGPHEVGTMTTVIDDGRPDPYDEGRPRRLAVQVWYPASPAADAETSPWLSSPSRFGSRTAAWHGLPPFVLDHLSLVRTHAVADAPLAPGGRRPLVVYSHGWSGFRGQHVTQLESLASRGFVVAAADHTHGAVASTFPDGRVVAIEPAALPEDAPADELVDAASLLVETYADDVAAAIDHLVDHPELGDAIDPTSLGLLGHSTGGGAALLACDREPACGAVVTYDPWIEPLPDKLVGVGIEAPMLSLRSEEWVAEDDDKRLRRLHAASGASQDSGLVAIAGATHRDFTLMPMLSPLASVLGASGSTGGSRVHDIVDEWTVAFLDHHLRARSPDPLERPPAHDETMVDR